MKKLFVLALVAVGLVACKKEEAATGNTAVIKQEEAVNTPASTALFDIARHEKSVQDIENHLGNKTNDTLYVTNFFATWCGPCMREIPHFQEQMKANAGKPVKFTFVSLDEKTAWPTDVKNFVEEKGLQKNTVLVDAATLPADFFTKNFKTWDGQSIPFTLFAKGEAREEYVGMISPGELQEKIQSLTKSAAQQN